MKVFLKNEESIDFCPVRDVFDRIGNKWAMMIVLTLGQTNHPMRYHQVQEAIGDISQKMLTATLKHLLEDGLIARQMYPEIPPRVDYSLTAKGESLLPHLYNLAAWANEHMRERSPKAG
ncbi:winged helix-turn-helix transcriptional regulator [Chitinophaga nivalis]|uniref:Helix-turn-helix transcriptional regulator n=1 Tax=Chitinophaga nivalis TaxID=2991709 RepID=A0ABT3ILK0_9BACT|nr:helix-turn-helix domain-containing protein [Chitinophaga nivalis]MCW3465471.1 helix-turn-helix transcriptional regulator [Chitinophaga nivalis]MCW3484838.1 helix-turn-helix transcriptional regulator [Chitinophaga nivalis]